MFKKILVPLDRSSLAEQAIGRAASIARSSGATIDLVLVHEPFPFAGYTDMPWSSEETTYERKYLETIAEELESGAKVTATCDVLRGAPDEMIRDRAVEIRADLIVMTSHGRTGFSRAWLGSVADAVIRRTAVPVLMIRPERAAAHRIIAETPIRRILVPLDGSSTSSDILPSAVDFAKACGASLTLLRVVPIVPIMLPYDPALPVGMLPLVPDAAATKALVDETTTQMETIAAKLAEDTSLSVEARVVVDEHAAKSIIDFADARAMDAIAMSTHGRGASRLVFGSVADKVLRGTGLPMLLRRPVGVVEKAVALGAEEIERQLPSLAPA